MHASFALECIGGAYPEVDLEETEGPDIQQGEDQ